MRILINHMLGRFRADDRASVSVEFVVLLPLLMLWFIGSFVFFDAFRTTSHAAKAAHTLSDIISREETVSNAFIQELYDLQEKLLPRTPDGKWLRVTSIIYDEDTDTYSVQWSKAVSPGGLQQAHDDDSLPLNLMPSMADNDTVILTETFVPYRPLVDWVGFGGMTWSNSLVSRPRFTGAIANTDS